MANTWMTYNVCPTALNLVCHCPVYKRGSWGTEGVKHIKRTVEPRSGPSSLSAQTLLCTPCWVFVPTLCTPHSHAPCPSLSIMALVLSPTWGCISHSGLCRRWALICASIFTMEILPLPPLFLLVLLPIPPHLKACWVPLFGQILWPE